MRGARWAAAAAGVALGVGTAGIAQAETFNIPPGRLGAVAAAIGAQAGITIAVPDPDLAARQSPGVRGNLSVRAALAVALRGTGTEAIFYDSATVRIVRQRAAPPPARAKPAPAPPPDAAPPADIIVTASKQGMSLDTYPGSVKLVELDPGWVADNGAGGTSALTKLLPTLGSTNLGPARNKLFIRGIADSSFNGPTQATVGQYLGDVRLNYNAPDPNLNLYDMKRVEVLVGPQGTLYGASSLGGIIRLVPNAPDTDAASATASAGVSSTRFGGPGVDGAVMVNLPMADGHVAFRLVAFGAHEGGYIDDPSRGLHDINQTSSYGQRMTLRIKTLSGWTVDLGVAIQNSTSSDGQYTLRGDPPLIRNSTIAQPFRNDYYLYYLTARGMAGSNEVVSTTSIVAHDLKTVFDATGHDGTTTPARFEEDNNITLISHETRMSGGGRRSPWVVGATGLFNLSILSRTLGPPDNPARIAGVVNLQAEAAVFGQYTHPLTSTLTGTIGGRLTYANSTGLLFSAASETSPQSGRDTVLFSSTLALDWHPTASFSAFFHYQQGYRAGGLAVAPSGSAVESRKFVADQLNMDELGIRWRHDRLSVRAAIFGADWNHIQADLIDSAGLPYTANIGRGRIFGLDGEVTWRPTQTLTVSAAAFVNDSKLFRLEPEFAGGSGRTLPNVARNGVRVATGWRRQLVSGVTLSGEASLRYVGESRLGVGPLLDIAQGNYLVGAAGGRLDLGKVAFSLNVENVGDVRGNSFAFGNPFGLAQRDQVTPLRPRTIRLGLDARF